AGSFSGLDCFIDSDGRGPSVAAVRAGSLCPLGKRDVAPSFLVWGDSHAAAMAPAIDIAAKKAKRGGLFVGAGGCAPLLDFDSGGTKRDKVRRCQEVNAAVMDLLATRRFQFVFMVGFWPKYVHRAELPDEGIFFDPSRPLPVDDHSAPVA